jgi:hypothetical protein
MNEIYPAKFILRWFYCRYKNWTCKRKRVNKELDAVNELNYERKNSLMTRENRREY